MSGIEIAVAVAALLGVALGAFAGGVVGMGFPVVAVPALAAAYGLETAVVVAAIPTLAIDLVNLHRTRAERMDASGLILFGSIAAVGSIVGTLIRGEVDERVLVGVLAATVLLYLVTEVLPKLDLTALAHRPEVGAIAGLTAGLLQATVAISGPIVGMFFLSRTDSRHAFIFHVTTVFTIMGIVRSVTLAGIGAFSPGRLWAGLGLAVIAVTLRTYGFRLGERLDRNQFRKLVLAVMTLSLVPLLIQTF